MGEALPAGTTPLFSPRRGSSMLDWYGRRIEEAEQTVLLTSAFGVTTRLAEYFDNDRNYLRYVLMEQRSRGEGAGASGRLRPVCRQCRGIDTLSW